MRSPIGEKGVATGSRCASAASAFSRTRLQHVDAQVDRRPLRQRATRLRRLGAKALGEGGRQPFRIVARDMRGRAGEIGAAQALALDIRKQWRRMAFAGEESGDLVDAETAQLLQGAENFGSRRRLAEQPGR